MSQEENTLIKERSFGRVDWYGGYNRKKDKENKFGFLNSDEHGSVFIHESELNCSPSDMKSGQWVTFYLISSKKGPSASDVDLAENESNISAILRLLKVSTIPIKIRLKLCFHIPLKQLNPPIPLVTQTIKEYEHSISGNHENFIDFINDETQKPFIEFPTSWREIDRKSSLYKVLPKQIREARFNREYPAIQLAIKVLSNSVAQIEKSADIYGSMSPQDKQLAQLWARDNSDYEQAKMLSARGAELITARFLSEIGKKVVDIAHHQISGESKQWQTHDLLVDSSLPIDVKNARNTINGKTFVEYTVKRFKKDALGRSVTIFGVFSPYLKMTKLKLPSLSLRDKIVILGATTQELVQNLEQEFSKRELTVNFGPPQRWPVWIFDNKLDWFADQREAIANLSKHFLSLEPEGWRDYQKRIIPAFLISGAELPAYYNDQLLAWQKWYVDKVIKKSKKSGLSLPWLYLFTFHHFIDAITNIRSAESKQYSPEGYNDLIFYVQNSFTDEVTTRPASLIDPLKIISKLINTLEVLWEHRHATRLNSLRSFTFRGEGLLKGIDSNGRGVSVLAYCGGFISGKGKCGNAPLVIGQNMTCSSCQMLICDKCGYCSERCKSKQNQSKYK